MGLIKPQNILSGVYEMLLAGWYGDERFFEKFKGHSTMNESRLNPSDRPRNTNFLWHSEMSGDSAPERDRLRQTRCTKLYLAKMMVSITVKASICTGCQAKREGKRKSVKRTRSAGKSGTYGYAGRQIMTVNCDSNSVFKQSIWRISRDTRLSASQNLINSSAG